MTRGEALVMPPVNWKAEARFTAGWLVFAIGILAALFGTLLLGRMLKLSPYDLAWLMFVSVGAIIAVWVYFALRLKEKYGPTQARYAPKVGAVLTLFIPLNAFIFAAFFSHASGPWGRLDLVASTFALLVLSLTWLDNWKKRRSAER